MLGHPCCRQAVRFNGSLLGCEDAEGNHATARIANVDKVVTHEARNIFLHWQESCSNFLDDLSSIFNPFVLPQGCIHCHSCKIILNLAPPQAPGK